MEKCIYALLLSFFFQLAPNQSYAIPTKNQPIEAVSKKKKKGGLFKRILQKKLNKKLSQLKAEHKNGRVMEPLSMIGLGLILIALLAGGGAYLLLFGLVLLVFGVLNFLSKPYNFKKGSLMVILFGFLLIYLVLRLIASL